MAKLKNLYDKISGLEEQLVICNQAYINLLEKYNKLYQKYSYEETMERIKEIDKVRKLEGKDILP